MTKADDQNNDNKDQDDSKNQDDKNQDDDSKLTEEEKQAAADKKVQDELDKDPDLKKPPAKKVEDDIDDDSDKDKDDKKSGKSDDDKEEDDDSADDDDSEDEDLEEDADDEDAEDPDSLSIEVEDKAGKKYKIKSEDDLPDDFEAKSAKALRKIFTQLDQLEARKEELRQDQKQDADNKALVKEARARMQSWDKEVDELVEQGRLPEKPKKGNDAYKTVDNVFKFMKSENERRSKAGRASVESFIDAFELYELAESRKSKDDKDKQEQEDAKKKGDKVGGSSAGSKGDNYIYRAGSAATIDDVPV